MEASGIHDAADEQKSLAGGIRRFLVGETLVRAADPAALLKEWTALPVPQILNSEP